MPTYARLPIEQLFLDAVNGELCFSNGELVTRPHGRGVGPGYQRDPRARERWVAKRSENFKHRLCRPLEVSLRPDPGTNEPRYAIMDGGGRWVLAQRANQRELGCIIHEGLTRKQEAKLFVQFDRQIYRLRSVDVFLAALGAGDALCTSVAHAIRPLRVAVSGPGHVSCVGVFYDTVDYQDGDTDLLGKVAKVINKGWMKYNEAEGTWGPGTPNAIGFGAVAILMDVAPNLSEPALIKAMQLEGGSFAKLLIQVAVRTKHTKATSDEKMRLLAEKLANKYNLQVAESRAIDKGDIRSSELLDTFAKRGSGASSRRFDDLDIAA